MGCFALLKSFPLEVGFWGIHIIAFDLYFNMFFINFTQLSPCFTKSVLAWNSWIARDNAKKVLKILRFMKIRQSEINDYCKKSRELLTLCFSCFKKNISFSLLKHDVCARVLYHLTDSKKVSSNYKQSESHAHPIPETKRIPIFWNQILKTMRR